MLETMNKFLVGIQGKNIKIMATSSKFRDMTKEEALNLAAWLVLLAEEEEGEFDKLLEEVRNT